MKNLWKEKLDRGEKTVGTFFESGSAAAIESMGFAGLDYVIIDTEHGPFEAESVGEFVCAAERRNLTPLARVREISRPAVLKLLDVGCKGLIIPQVHSIEDVRQVVEYGKYYPIGSRGVAGQRSNGFTYDMGGSLDEWFRNANEETLLIPQCETMGCLEDIENIAAAAGVAGIFIGPYDLSTAMGMPGQFSNPEFLKAVRRIIDACHAAGKFCMIYCDNAKKAQEYFKSHGGRVSSGGERGTGVSQKRNISSAKSNLTQRPDAKCCPLSHTLSLESIPLFLLKYKRKTFRRPDRHVHSVRTDTEIFTNKNYTWR